MTVRLTALTLAAALLTPAAPADSELTQGIALVKEGDFERAVPRLDAAIQRLGPKGSKRELAQAHLYLGIAYLELDQEATARGRFREALRNDPGLRLDTGSFSPQTVRVFDAARAEMPQEKKKRTPVLLIAGGGAAAAGIALAAASGGGGSAAGSTTTAPGGPTTTSPAVTTTTTPTTTPTTTTTTTLPAACRYTLSPASQSFPASGGQGTCNITTGNACGWTVESSEDWITIQGGKNGVGSASIRFNVKRNNGGARKGRIRIREEDVRCEINQAAGSLSLAMGSVTWSSRLEVEDGRGRIVMGAQASAVGRGRVDGAAPARAGDNLVEAMLLAGHGDGTWRFEVAGTRPGSLRPVAGEVVLLTADAIVFRLKGEPGERVAFAYLAAGVD